MTDSGGAGIVMTETSSNLVDGGSPTGFTEGGNVNIAGPSSGSTGFIDGVGSAEMTGTRVSDSTSSGFTDGGNVLITEGTGTSAGVAEIGPMSAAGSSGAMTGEPVVDSGISGEMGGGFDVLPVISDTGASVVPVETVVSADPGTVVISENTGSMSGTVGAVDASSTSFTSESGVSSIGSVSGDVSSADSGSMDSVFMTSGEPALSVVGSGPGTATGILAVDATVSGSSAATADAGVVLDQGGPVVIDQPVIDAAPVDMFPPNVGISAGDIMAVDAGVVDSALLPDVGTVTVPAEPLLLADAGNVDPVGIPGDIVADTTGATALPTGDLGLTEPIPTPDPSLMIIGESVASPDASVALGNSGVATNEVVIDPAPTVNNVERTAGVSVDTSVPSVDPAVTGTASVIDTASVDATAMADTVVVDAAGVAGGAAILGETVVGVDQPLSLETVAVVGEPASPVEAPVTVEAAPNVVLTESAASGSETAADRALNTQPVVNTVLVDAPAPVIEPAVAPAPGSRPIGNTNTFTIVENSEASSQSGSAASSGDRATLVINPTTIVKQPTGTTRTQGSASVAGGTRTAGSSSNIIRPGGSTSSRSTVISASSPGVSGVVDQSSLISAPFTSNLSLDFGREWLKARVDSGTHMPLSCFNVE